MKWTKKLDEVHLVRDNREQRAGTVCGKSMLGNNYMELFKYNPKTKKWTDFTGTYPTRDTCPKCLEKI